MRTQQEIFDYVAEKLHAQNLLSAHYRDDFSDMTQCLYRGPDGTKCAAGWLIPDEAYDPDMDNTANATSINDIAEWFADRVPEEVKNNLPFVLSLQSAHDTALVWDKHFRVGLKKNLDDVASRYGLSTETIDQLDWS